MIVASSTCSSSTITGLFPVAFSSPIPSVYGSIPMRADSLIVLFATAVEDHALVCEVDLA
jgi:hypothetical protein